MLVGVFIWIHAARRFGSKKRGFDFAPSNESAVGGKTCIKLFIRIAYVEDLTFT